MLAFCLSRRGVVELGSCVYSSANVGAAMSLRAGLQRVLADYESAQSMALTNHPLALFVRDELAGESSAPTAIGCCIANGLR